MNQMDSYNPSFFNQPSAHHQFVTTSPAHAQPAHQPPPPPQHFPGAIATPHHPQAQLQFNGAPAGGFPLVSSMGTPSQSTVSNGAGGVMMQQPQSLQHQQQSPRVPQSPYSTASFSTPISAPPISAAQHFAHFNKTVSPSRHISPYATPQQQQQHHQQHHFPQQSQPDLSQPMAAPVNLPPQAQSKVQTPAKPSAQAVPPSPGAQAAQARDRERVTLLLDINRELLQEILKLQEQGKGGLVGQPPSNQDGNQDANNKVASKEYIDCMRRLQANLSYLASTAERASKPNQPVPPGPAIMVVPSTSPVLAEMYTKLQALFPGWRGGQPGKPPMAGQSPQRPPTMQSSSPQQVPLQG